MSYVTVNEAGVSQGRLCSPLTGAWHFDAFVTSASGITGAATVDLGGALTLTGTVLTGGVYVESTYLRIIAGKGGWVRPCAVKFYQGATLGTIIGDILSGAGETLSTTSGTDARGVPLDSFSTTAGTVGANVRALMAYAPAGTSWRFLSNGQFWIGPESWPEFGEEYQITNETPQERRLEVGFEAPTLLAGQSVVAASGSVHLCNVETSISAAGFKARAWWQS